MARKPSKTSSVRVQSAERRAEILRLRKQKLSLQEIADRVGIAKQSVHEHIQAALRTYGEEIKELTDDLRAMQFEETQDLKSKLQTALAVMEHAMSSGDLSVLKS